MIAYFFTGWISQFKQGVLMDSCRSLIVHGGNLDEAKARFETWLCSAEDENPLPTKIEEIIFAPILERMFTESGDAPIDWLEVCEHANLSFENVGLDDFDQGGWVDCNQVIRSEKLSADLKSLQRELPEEIRSGLNWQADKQFFFLLSVLAPTQVIDSNLENESIEDDLVDPKWREREDVFPELAERKITVLAQARNSVAATWLWRNYEAEKQLARGEIRMDPWCGAETV